MRFPGICNSVYKICLYLRFLVSKSDRAIEQKKWFLFTIFIKIPNTCALFAKLQIVNWNVQRGMSFLPTRLRCATMKIIWICSPMNFWIYCWQVVAKIANELDILLRSDRGKKLIIFLHLCHICWFVLCSVLFLANFIF